MSAEPSVTEFGDIARKPASAAFMKSQIISVPSFTTFLPLDFSSSSCLGLPAEALGSGVEEAAGDTRKELLHPAQRDHSSPPALNTQFEPESEPESEPEFEPESEPESEPEFEPEFSPGQLSNRDEPDRSVLSKARGCRCVQDTGAEQLIHVFGIKDFIQMPQITQPQDVQEAP